MLALLKIRLNSKWLSSNKGETFTAEANMKMCLPSHKTLMKGARRFIILMQ